jgi:anti-sigma B factor antagonist
MVGSIARFFEAPVNREFLVDRRGDVTQVLLTGQIDLLTAPAVKRAMQRALLAPGSRVLINLDAVTFIDSVGLGVIVAGYHRAVALGIGFELGPPGVPAVARVLAVTGLDQALTVDPAGEEDTGTAG